MAITRRWFIVGAAAALTAAKLNLNLAPNAVANTPAKLLPMPRREITELTFMLDEGGRPTVNLWLSVDSGPPVLQFRLAAGGILRWLSAIDEGLILLPEHTLRINVTPDPGERATLSLLYKGDDGTRFAELIKWKDGGALTTERHNLIRPTKQT